MKPWSFVLSILAVAFVPRNGSANEPAAFVPKVTVANLTGRAIVVKTYVFAGRAGYTTEQIALGRGEMIGHSSQNVAIKAGEKGTVDLASILSFGGKKHLNEPGLYAYMFQSYYSDGYAEDVNTMTNISNSPYSGEDLKAAEFVVKVEQTEASEAQVAKREAREATKKRAEDPNQRGTLTIVNWRGEKIYCELQVPKKNGNSSITKQRFVLDAEKGSKHVLKDLRLFAGYHLLAAQSEVKLGHGELVIHDAMPGQFQMETNKVINVGRRGANP